MYSNTQQFSKPVLVDRVSLKPFAFSYEVILFATINLAKKIIPENILNVIDAILSVNIHHVKKEEI